jgi:general secretion pathway protein B
MSYILDALKRAERERRQGQVSVLDEAPTVPPAGEPPRSLARRLLLPGAALGLAILLAAGGWLWGQRSARARPAAPERAAAAPAPVAQAQRQAPQPAPPALAPAAPKPARIEDAARIGSLDDLVPGAPKPQAAPAAAVQAAARETAAPAAAPPSSPAQVATAAPPGATSPAAPGASTAPAPTAQNLQLMPDSYRAEFPQFTVNVHSYSDDPARRFVLIDGKQYHEGDTLPQGPHIVAIVPEGIVLDWKGSRVLYALNR